MKKESILEESQKYTEKIPKENFGSIENIEDTAFTIAQDLELGWFLAMGHNRITKHMPTREEAIELLEKDKWNIIMIMIIIVVEKITGKTARVKEDNPQDS